MVYMPFVEDDETRALIDRLEQHRARLLEIMTGYGADYYEIGLIREQVDTDRTLIEAWLIPMFEDEERKITEFDRSLTTTRVTCWCTWSTGRITGTPTSRMRSL